MKKAIVAIVSVFLVTSLIGCDAVQKKFTRKKKTVVKPRFYQIKKYPKKPAPELYQKHYSYWRTWQAELINNVGKNSKKETRAIDEALGHLNDMHGLLVPSKADQLEKHIVTMENIKVMIHRGSLTYATQDYVRSSLEREDRIIRSDFCYDKVRNFLITVKEEEPAPKLSMAQGEGAPVEPAK